MGLGKSKITYKKGENHHRSSITNNQAEKIIDKLRETSLSYEEIAKEYNTSYQIVQQINLGISWRHIEREIPIRYINTRISGAKRESIINQLNSGKSCEKVSKSVGVDLDYIENLKHLLDNKKFIADQKELYKKIDNLLINTTLTQTEIAKKFGIKINSVHNRSVKLKRQGVKTLKEMKEEEVIYLLETTLYTLAEISRTTGVSLSAVRRISGGVVRPNYKEASIYSITDGEDRVEISLEGDKIFIHSKNIKREYSAGRFDFDRIMLYIFNRLAEKENTRRATSTKI